MRLSFSMPVSLILSLLALLASACGAEPPSSAVELSPTLEVREAWARPVTHMEEHGDGELGHEMGANGAVYLLIANGTSTDDRLTGVMTGVASVAELHLTSTENNVMRMEMVPAIEVPAGSVVTLEPGGYHIMLIDLHDDLVAGDSFEITLTFEEAGERTVPVEVREP